MGKPRGKDSRENHRSFDPHGGVRDTAATALEESTSKLYEMKICDQRGNPLPQGMSMTGSIDTSAWPQVVWTDMIGVEAIPESIMLVLPQTITVK